MFDSLRFNCTLLFKLFHDKHCIFASIFVEGFIREQIDVKIQCLHVNDLRKVFKIHFKAFFLDQAFWNFVDPCSTFPLSVKKD